MEENKVEDVINIIKDMDIKDKLRLAICMNDSQWKKLWKWNKLIEIK